MKENVGTCSPNFYYLDTRTVEKLLQGFSEDLMKDFLSIPKDTEIPKRPVLLLQEECADYNVPTLLILNYEKCKGLLLGVGEETYRMDDPPWFRRIWAKVADFFGWHNEGPSTGIIIEPWIPVSKPVTD